MRLRRLLAGCGLVVLLSASAAGDTITRDPEIGVDAGTLSSPISTGTTFIPNGNGGGSFGFYNGTGQIITGLVFQTTIQSGLDPGGLASVFSCNDANSGNPFFLNCSIGYASSTGALTISFYGVNPSDADELPTDPVQQNEIGEQEGIPPILVRCASTPDDQNHGCTDIGHFVITLNDSFITDPLGTGGWSNTATPGIFTESGLTFNTTEIDTAPEPSPAILLATVLLFLVAIARRTRRV